MKKRNQVWVIEVRDSTKANDPWEPCTFRCYDTKAEAIRSKQEECEDSASWYRWRIRKYVAEEGTDLPEALRLLREAREIIERCTPLPVLGQEIADKAKKWLSEVQP